MDTQKNKIFFRADAGPQIGYGHFIRSLALADMLKEDFDCTFFTQAPTDYQLRELQNVCPCVSLPDDDSKFQLFLNYLTGNEIVVLDNYFFTTDYQRQIKAKGCKLVCIDDMHDKHYVADVVINHGCSKPEVFDVEPYTRLCLGLDWALLRKPFLEAAKQQYRTYSDKIKKVVICFGGSDVLHLTEKALDNILQNSEIQQVDAIVSASFDDNAYKNNKRVHLHHNISAQEVADLFIHCDLAIVSASSVCIEALACGAKVAAGWYVDNQVNFYDLLSSNDLVIELGNLSQTFIDLCKIDFCQPIINNIDANIKKHYVSLFHDLKKGCYLREARLADMDLLYAWVNDPIVRQSAFNSDEISYENHINWFNGCLQREDVKIYIFIINNIPTGQVRLNIEQNDALIDYSIASEFRGQGLGNVIIELISEKVKFMKDVNYLIAYVKPENKVSQKVFQKNGFGKYLNESGDTGIFSYKKKCK